MLYCNASIMRLRPPHNPQGEKMGIFDATAGDLFAEYKVKLRFRERLMGGIPANPEIIEAWLRNRFLGSDEERKRLVLETLRDLGAQINNELSDEEKLDDAMKQVAAERNGVCFKRNGEGLYIEMRNIKAMLKEVTNILFAGERWGKTYKGPKNFVAERVFIHPYRIFLGIEEPDGVDLFVGHVNGPQGPRSTLTYYEFAEQREIDFIVKVTGDDVEEAAWPLIWMQAQENGLGALRSQGHGTFDILEWEKIRDASWDKLRKATVREPAKPAKKAKKVA